MSTESTAAEATPGAVREDTRPPVWRSAAGGARARAFLLAAAATFTSSTSAPGKINTCMSAHAGGRFLFRHGDDDGDDDGAREEDVEDWAGCGWRPGPTCFASDLKRSGEGRGARESKRKDFLAFMPAFI